MKLKINVNFGLKSILNHLNQPELKSFLGYKCPKTAKFRFIPDHHKALTQRKNENYSFYATEESQSAPPTILRAFITAKAAF